MNCILTRRARAPISRAAAATTTSALAMSILTPVRSDGGEAAKSILLPVTLMR